MYNISKIKRWIKKSAKDILLYDPETEVISDSRVLLRVVAEMKPTLLEVFGHLDGGQRERGKPYGPAPENMDQFLELKPEAKRIIDSRLSYPDPGIKGTGRILYFPDTGEKVCINHNYVDLFKEFEYLHLWAVNGSSAVYVCNQNNVTGLIFPYRTDSDVLKSFKFAVKGA